MHRIGLKFSSIIVCNQRWLVFSPPLMTDNSSRQRPLLSFTNKKNKNTNAPSQKWRKWCKTRTRCRKFLSAWCFKVFTHRYFSPWSNLDSDQMLNLAVIHTRMNNPTKNPVKVHWKNIRIHLKNNVLYLCFQPCCNNTISKNTLQSHDPRGFRNCCYRDVWILETGNRLLTTF